MKETIVIEIPKAEAELFQQMVEECLAAIKQANEQIAKDQAEIDRLKAETRAIIASINQGPVNVEKYF